jgi:putative effector of murein hydrolase LrgA (UPF0299 family)
MQGLQILLLVAIGGVLVGLICGTVVYLMNRAEIKRLGKDSYR